MTKRRKDKNVHHVIGRVRRDQYNVEIPQNKIVVDIVKHDALNCLMNINQDPKSQLKVMKEQRWDSVLSDKTKRILEALIQLPDDQFYIQEVIKPPYRKPLSSKDING